MKAGLPGTGQQRGLEERDHRRVELTVPRRPIETRRIAADRRRGLGPVSYTHLRLPASAESRSYVVMEEIKETLYLPVDR